MNTNQKEQGQENNKIYEEFFPTIEEEGFSSDCRDKSKYRWTPPKTSAKLACKDERIFYHSLPLQHADYSAT